MDTGSSAPIVLRGIRRFAGFAVEDRAPGPPGSIWINTCGGIASDDHDFNSIVGNLTAPLLGAARIPENSVLRLLAVWHEEDEVELFVNDFDVQMEILSRKAIQAGDAITYEAIADIRRISFPQVTWKKRDVFAYVFKEAWRLGLYFDLRCSHPSSPDFNCDSAEREIARLTKRMRYSGLYECIEAGKPFEQMMADWWFPYNEILYAEFEEIARAYRKGWDTRAVAESVIAHFDERRVRGLCDKWWSKSVFLTRKALLVAGIEQFIAGTDAGTIVAINTLMPQLEGLLRDLHYSTTKKGKEAHTRKLIQTLSATATQKLDTADSLLLPNQFCTLLEEHVLRGAFDLSSPTIRASRDSVAHGVLKASEYTRVRSLQLILMLDQIYWYL